MYTFTATYTPPCQPSPWNEIASADSCMSPEMGSYLSLGPEMNPTRLSCMTSRTCLIAPLHHFRLLLLVSAPRNQQRIERTTSTIQSNPIQSIKSSKQASKLASYLSCPSKLPLHMLVLSYIPSVPSFPSLPRRQNR